MSIRWVQVEIFNFLWKFCMGAIRKNWRTDPKTLSVPPASIISLYTKFQLNWMLRSKVMTSTTTPTPPPTTHIFRKIFEFFFLLFSTFQVILHRSEQKKFFREFSEKQYLATLLLGKNYFCIYWLIDTGVAFNLLSCLLTTL